MLWIAGAFIVVLVVVAFLIDRRNRKIKNDSLQSINSHAKPGESTNYMMGDNKYTNGS